MIDLCSLLHEGSSLFLTRQSVISAATIRWDKIVGSTPPHICFFKSVYAIKGFISNLCNFKKILCVHNVFVLVTFTSVMIVFFLSNISVAIPKLNPKQI